MKKICLSCGKIFERSFYEVLRRWKIRKFCSHKCTGISKIKDITGQKFSGLTAIKRISKYLWLFKCDCGKEKIIQKSSVLNKRTKSCGCKRVQLSMKTKYENGFRPKLIKSSHGYFKIWKDVKSKHIYEHRKVMEKELLEFPNPSKMHVHHIDGNKENNNKENLIILDAKTHLRLGRGWILENKKWFKTCLGCNQKLEVNTTNFYRRKMGKFLPRCKKCTLKDLRERKYKSLSLL